MWKKILALATVFMLPLTMQNAFAASQKVVMDGDHGKLSGILQLPDKKSNIHWWLYFTVLHPARKCLCLQNWRMIWNRLA